MTIFNVVIWIFVSAFSHSLARWIPARHATAGRQESEEQESSALQILNVMLKENKMADHSSCWLRDSASYCDGFQPTSPSNGNAEDYLDNNHSQQNGLGFNGVTND
ncbi:hypothetical protein MMC14_008834, partial [Varicellaria rhodocarpa]|nr:hypothetical protein [Varicellaria rhodocarpa]